MKQLKKYMLSFGLFIFLFCITCYFIFSKYPLQDFLNSLKPCNPIDIVLAFSCIFFYLLLGTLFLKSIMKVLKCPITFLKSLCYNCIEIYFSAITPSSTGGQPAEIYYMMKDNIPFEKSTIAIFVNTILYKLVIVLLLCISIILFPHKTLQNGVLFTFLMFLGMFLNLVVVSFFSCLLFSKKIPRIIIYGSITLLKKLHIIKEETQIKFNQKAENILKEYQNYAKFIQDNPKLLFKSFALITMQRISLFSISYFIYHSFGLREYNYFEIVFLQIAITSAIDSVPSPGGVMIGEGLTFQINTLIYGSTFALSSMLLLRGISFYFLVLICSILYAYHHLIGRKKNSSKIE